MGQCRDMSVVYSVCRNPPTVAQCAVLCECTVQCRLYRHCYCTVPLYNRHEFICLVYVVRPVGSGPAMARSFFSLSVEVFFVAIYIAEEPVTHFRGPATTQIIFYS